MNALGQLGRGRFRYRGHRLQEGPYRAVGPSPVQSIAAYCSPLQGRRRKYTLFLTLLTDWPTEGQGFDPPQLHQQNLLRPCESRAFFLFVWPRISLKPRQRSQLTYQQKTNPDQLRKIEQNQVLHLTESSKMPP